MRGKEAALDANGYPKFGLRDKLAYAAGDFGCNMSFALKSYLTIFWTQFMGIDQILISGLLLLVQVWDAINDPLIGSFVDADHRPHRMNKFLLYITIGAIGLTVAGALCFVPWVSAPSMVKNILFIAGYIIWDAFYTVANVPYGSVMSLITTSSAERASLSTFRSVGSMIANLATGMILPVIIYDAGNNLLGERMFWIALLMGGIGLLFFVFMIRNTTIRVDTEIRVKEDGPKEKFNFFRTLKNFLRNRAAVGASLAAMGSFIGMYGAQTASQSMFQSYFKMAQWSGVISMISYVGLFAFMPFASRITRKFGKKEGLTVGYAIACAAYILMLVLPITPDMNGLAMYVGCQLLAAVGNGYGSCVAWAMIADAMDYEEWKFGERNEGTTYALYSFFRKLAQGVGPSLGVVLATFLGYNADLGPDQPANVASNMRYLVAAMALFAAAFQLCCYLFVYNIDRKTLETIENDLSKKHGGQ